MEFSPIPIANKIFHVTVVFVRHYCDQFVASEIRHSMHVTAVFVNKQHGVQRRKPDFDKVF